MRTRGRCKVVWGVLGAWLVLGTVVVSEAGAPMETMRQTLDGLVAIFADETLKAPEQTQERRAKIHAVLSQRFAYKDMAQQALGRHWDTLTQAQQHEFVTLFSALLEQRHLERIEKYGGTDKSIVYTKEALHPDGTASVHIEIVNPRDPSVNEEVEYRLAKQDNDWRVYDLLIEGSSMVTNFRAQFDSIIRQETYAELVRRLKMSPVSDDKGGKGSR